MAHTVDFVIVGGGLAGCVIASRLHEAIPSSSVLIIEAGPDAHEDERVSVPINCFQLHGTELEYNYKTVPQPALGGRQIPTFGGKMLGGGSSCNYGLWTRGDSSDYDVWGEMAQDTRWSYQGMLPYFRKNEQYYDTALSPGQHGNDGPMHIVKLKDRGFALREPILKAWEAAGVKAVPDMNNGFPHGVAPATACWKNAERQSSNTAYNLQGVQILTNTVAKRIILDEKDGKKSAVGVELADGKTIAAKKQVILSCGAARTPQVLMLSGIGPKAELHRHGIRQAVDLPVGQNFHDHVAVTLYWKLKHPEIGASIGSPLFNKPEYLEGVPIDWVVTETANQADLEAALVADGEDPSSHSILRGKRGHFEVATPYAPASANFIDAPVGFDGTHITTGILNLLPTSRGSVTLNSTDPGDDPILDPAYCQTHADFAILRHGIKLTLRMVESEAGKSQIECETSPDGSAPLTSKSSDADIDARIKRSASTWWHMGGTASMGRVVDSDLRVYGVDKLRVADASVIPTPIAAHYQAAVYALAEQAADIISKESLETAETR